MVLRAHSLTPTVFAACFLALLSSCAHFSPESDAEFDPNDPIAVAAAKIRGDTPMNPEEAELLAERVEKARNTGDLTLGMGFNDVRSTWGEPWKVEHAGDGSHGNQRWIYLDGFAARWSVSPARIVYFESGRVAGWEHSRLK